MTSAVAMVDPGPLARLEDVKRDGNAMGVIVQRVAEGETLKDVAKAWRVPYGKLYEWITESPERSRQYVNACRCAGVGFLHEAVPIADGANEESRNGVAKAGLRATTRLKVAEILMSDAPDPRDSLQPDQLFDSLIALIEANPTLAARVRTALGEKVVATDAA